MKEHHSHSHHHGHHHHHHSHDDSRSLAIAFFLNLSFTVIELVGGILTNSVSILSDAVHDLGDSVALGMAWRYEKLSHKTKDQTHTYGYRRYSILGALITVGILTAGSFALFFNGIQRLLHPEEVHSVGMLWLAIVGILINGFAAWRVSGKSSHSHKAVTLHLLEDVLGWVAILVGSIAIYYTGAMWIDPALSLLINLFIFWQVSKRIKSLIPILMQSSPEGLDFESVRSEILRLPNVVDAHSFQAWSLDGERHVLSCHILIDQADADILIQTKAKTKDLLLKHNVLDTTIEFELPNEVCGDKPTTE